MVVAAVMLLAAVVVAVAIVRALRPRVPPLPYRRKASLFTRDHQSVIQQQRDAEKDEVLRQAGLPLVRIASQKGGYTAKALADVIGEALGG